MAISENENLETTLSKVPPGTLAYVILYSSSREKLKILKFLKILESLCFDIVYKGFWHFLITNLYRFISVYRSETVNQVKNGFPIKLEFCGVYPQNDNFIYTNSI